MDIIIAASVKLNIAICRLGSTSHQQHTHIPRQRSNEILITDLPMSTDHRGVKLIAESRLLLLLRLLRTSSNRLQQLQQHCLCRTRASDLRSLRGRSIRSPLVCVLSTSEIPGWRKKINKMNK